jgi:hypothetical protein
VRGMTSTDHTGTEIPVSRARKLAGYGLVLLFPLAVLTAVVVLVAMASASASATGGCGCG